MEKKDLPLVGYEDALEAVFDALEITLGTDYKQHLLWFTVCRKVFSVMYSVKQDTVTNDFNEIAKRRCDEKNCHPSNPKEYIECWLKCSRFTEEKEVKKGIRVIELQRIIPKKKIIKICGVCIGAAVITSIALTIAINLLFR